MLTHAKPGKDVLPGVIRNVPRCGLCIHWQICSVTFFRQNRSLHKVPAILVQKLGGSWTSGHEQMLRDNPPDQELAARWVCQDIYRRRAVLRGYTVGGPEIGGTAWNRRRSRSHGARDCRSS